MNNAMYEKNCKQHPMNCFLSLPVLTQALITLVCSTKQTIFQNNKVI